MKTIHDFALDILQERQAQLSEEHRRTERELALKQAELDSINRYVRVLTEERTKLEKSMADLERAIKTLNQSTDLKAE